MDAEHAKKSLVFRLGVAALLLLSAVAKWLSKSLFFNYLAAYLSLAFCEVALLNLFKGLEGGLAVGAGQLLYVFLGSVLLCGLYPIKLNLLGCTALALVPHIFGALSGTDFPHVLYASVIGPTTALAMLIHWKIRLPLVENIRLRQEVESSALVDPVTGLLNPHGLDLAFQRLHKLDALNPLQAFFLLIKIDGLDEIERIHGEHFARSLHGQMGQIINVSFRGRDIIASLGDEFVCILPHVSREKTVDIAERFREIIAIKEFDCPTVETGILHCTVSIGIVPDDTKEKDTKTLVNRARVAISQARYQGENQCVCLYNSDGV